MVPGWLMEVERVPLTANGKVDRRALPEPDMSKVVQDEYVAPRTGTEGVLAAIWAGLLGVERIGIHDNFFELGGHSLLATRVISAVRRHLGKELPVRLLFQYPTVAGLAEQLPELPGEPFRPSPAGSMLVKADALNS
jgi:acyl carrier protein